MQADGVGHAEGAPSGDGGGGSGGADDDGGDDGVHLVHEALVEEGAKEDAAAFDHQGENLSLGQGREEGAEIDVIYRVVGTATRWMASLRKGDRISVLGPQGNEFPISSSKRQAWLIAGGVGLPPMLWLAQALYAAGKRTVAFFGAQRGDLIPLTLDPATPTSVDAHTATPSAAEFNESDTGVVISTDDGSVGFTGHVGAALANYHEANPIDTGDVVAYTCGPERMMRYVAEFCITREIECYVCLERTMACGTGMCQS